MEAAIKMIPGAIRHYLAHNLSAIHQQDKIEQMHEELANDPNAIILVMYRKKMVLPKRYREAQSEFYGKTSTSSLGVTKTYLRAIKYSDHVIDGYASQDHVQMFALLVVIQNEVEKDTRMSVE